MRVPRIYQDIEMQADSLLELDAQAAVHVARVLRLKVNDQVIVFNGRGGEFLGFIAGLERRSVQIRLTAYRDKNIESPLDITLAQCVSRGDRMDFAIQKSVELGVTGIVPLTSAHGAVNLPKDRLEKRRQHWQKIAITACEQCGRNVLPALSDITPLADWLPTTSTQFAFVLSPSGGENIKQMTIPVAASITLLIGPEGGLSDQELKQAVDQGFIPLTLGRRVLRTETAAVVALSVLQTLWGDFL